MARSPFLLSAVWAVLMGVTFGGLARYEARAGESAAASSDWPQGVLTQPAEDRSTLVMFVTPQCPCSRASVGELDRLMTTHGNALKAMIVFRNGGKPSDGTSLWKTAAAIRGVELESDMTGEMTRAFGAVTAGQAYLYDKAGKLQYSGGLTISRGHAGDSDGTRAIRSILEGKTPATRSGEVFGCALE